MDNAKLNVYLAGEIHTDWRERIIEGSKEKGLDVEFTSPVTDHDLSDICGVNILGEEEKPFWRECFHFCHTYLLIDNHCHI